MLANRRVASIPFSLTLLNQQRMGGDWYFNLLGSEWRNARDLAVTMKDASTP